MIPPAAKNGKSNRKGLLQFCGSSFLYSAGPVRAKAALNAAAIPRAHRFAFATLTHCRKTDIMTMNAAAFFAAFYSSESEKELVI